MYRKSIMLLLVFLFIIFQAELLSAKNYRPELSGNMEVGDKSFSDLMLEGDEEEIVDQYWYRRCWLKYKQKLTSSDYYYFKIQNYQKEYFEQVNYNNISWDFWANYTHKLQEKLRNKWLINLRKKDYSFKPQSTYHLAKITYQIDYDYNKKQDYSICLQRQWEDYLYEDSNDNICDKISLNWDYKLTADFELNSNLQFFREIYQNVSERSNKRGNKLSLGFKWDL